MYVLDRGPESGMCCSFVLSARRFQNTLAGNEIELAPPQTGSRFLFIQWQAQIMILIAKVIQRLGLCLCAQGWELGILRFLYLRRSFLTFTALWYFLRLFRVSAFTHCLLIENQEEFQVLVVYFVV